MSCKHGNWSPCDECDAEDAEKQASTEYGFSEGIKAASRTICGQTEPPRRWRIEIGYTVIRDVDIIHFMAPCNGYTDADRSAVFALGNGQTVRVSRDRTITAALHNPSTP